jgi:single-strand DNA-binding protein
MASRRRTDHQKKGRIVAQGDVTITVVGNLGGPAELRFTPSGAAVANFSVASTPRKLNRQTGDWEDGEPLWLRCNVWRDMAEHVAETLSEKGMRVIVQGRLRQRQYEKDGQTRTVYELEVDEVGPALRYATAKVAKVSGGGERTVGSGQRRGPSDNFQDPWAGSSGGGRSAPKSSSAFDDEPPF